ASTATIANLVGVRSGADAFPGNVGQYVESLFVSSNTPPTAQYGDAGSISLTAGDWDVSAQGFFEANGATWTRADIGITPNANNNTAGLVDGSNHELGLWASTTNVPSIISMAIAVYRVSITATTTYYFKYSATYSASGPPRLSGRISARRVR